MRFLETSRKPSTRHSLPFTPLSNLIIAYDRILKTGIINLPCILPDFKTIGCCLEV
ncbi:MULTISPECIES: hypothetical protein [Pseudothermotoga]|uniref:hypothetical protein n=1 Tax=Pseudothermotoga TaxID=1643951 RepID=UPI000315D4C4|nr:MULTISPECIES: hypothetical protein [Pseudothermotoga]